MQIKEIILYGKVGERRVLSFALGKVNVITGDSKTGKSALGDIIDYCFGQSSCNIAAGVIRDTVEWYGLLLEHNSEYFFIARQNPPFGQISTSNCRYMVGIAESPLDIAEAAVLDVESLKVFLSNKIGISENLYQPKAEHTRRPLEASIRHTLYYCIQKQDEIASQGVLFHRQNEPFMAQTIKDSIPFFLGIINSEMLLLGVERDRLRRKTTVLRKRIEEIRALEGGGLPKGIGLFFEAQEVGLLSSQASLESDNYSAVRKLLEQTMRQKEEPNVEVATSGMNQVSALQFELKGKEDELDRVNISIRDAQLFSSETHNYHEEVRHQARRLESINLFDQLTEDSLHDLVDFEDARSFSSIRKEILSTIEGLSNSLENANREEPKVLSHIRSLKEHAEELSKEIGLIKARIEEIYKENEAAAKLRDINSRRARTIGRISLWLESVVASDELTDKEAYLEQLNSRIAELDEILSADAILDKEQAIIILLTEWMTKWARELDLEHSEHSFFLDLRRLTVVANSLPPIALAQMGSASNWLGCHLITLFALHKFFIENNRPVPRFIFMDQPSQVYFPPEGDAGSADWDEIRKVYEFIFAQVEALNSNMQIILVDHADINESYFQEAIVEEWRDGHKLIPEDWISVDRLQSGL